MWERFTMLRPKRSAMKCARFLTLKILQAIVLIVAVLVGSQGLQADPVADFYKGKMIEFIVGGNAGGGYDIYSRAIARRLTAHIPGNPNIVVKNSPGAGSLIAARTLFYQSPKDGLTIGMIFRGAVMEPLLGNADAAKFDPRKFNFLASANTETGVCLVRPDAKVQSFKQLFTDQLIVSAAGRGSAIGDMPVILNNLLHTKLKIVAGYKGTLDSLHAVESGEVEGICGYQYSSLAVQFPSWVPEKKVNVLVQIGMTGHEDLNKLHIPMIWDFVSDPDDRKVLELIFGQLEFGRPFVAPPGVPADRVAALRNAFAATFKDPIFLEDVKRLKLDLDPRSGEDVQSLVEKIFDSTPAQIARAREVSK
jgi:tripartite-type tricarboxylate transporter receptor subunit TctC